MSSFSRPDKHRTQQFTHRGTAKTDLERDSGFSDASSEYHSTVELTDSEESGRNGSKVSQDPTTQQVAVMGGSYTGLSPMIIMNNFVLNQPSAMSPAENQWGFSSPVEVMPQSQVVLLQPMVSNGSSSSPKSGCENTRQSKSYMPVLKSYPKIAPHPGEVLTKKVGSSRMRGTSAAGYEQRQRKHHHGHRPYSSPSPQPALQTPVKQNNSFEAVNSQTQAADIQGQLCGDSLSPLTGIASLPPYTHEFWTSTNTTVSADKYQDTLSMDNKLKRFSNTYNILNKSGLLGITMRTKQLIKENKRTQSQLQQLQEQTTMLLKALSSGDSQLWTKLQLSMQDADKEQCNIKPQTVLV